MIDSDPTDVVLHVSDGPSDLDRALATAALLRDARPHLRLRVVINGSALRSAVGQEPLPIPEGTEVVACATGLRNQGLDSATLRPGVVLVPSAAVELVDSQRSGAAYLRI